MSTAKTTPDAKPTKPRKEGQGKRKLADEEDQPLPVPKKQATSVKRSRKTTQGLKNHGNELCYFNAVIQVVANCDPLANQLASSFEQASDKQREIALSHEDLRATGRGSSRAMKALKKRLDDTYSEIGADKISLSAEFGRLVAMMWGDEERSSSSPLQLAAAHAQLWGGGFEGNTKACADGIGQQDALEFLNQAIDRLDQEAGKSPELTNVWKLLMGHWAVMVRNSLTPPFGHF